MLFLKFQHFKIKQVSSKLLEDTLGYVPVRDSTDGRMFRRDLGKNKRASIQSRTQSPQAPWSAVWSPGETLGKWNFFNFFDWLFG